MGLFESNPWVLIPIIVVTVEGWFAVKKALFSWVRPKSTAGKKHLPF
jgi:hypothetical protein